MKKGTLILAVLALSLVSSTIFAQKFAKLDVSPMDAAAYPTSWKETNKLVKIIYGRPQLKGRPLSKLAPNDKVWRTGANEAPEITFYKDVMFGGKKLKAGTYALFTIPGDKEWTVIISNQLNNWGSYYYNEDLEVLKVKANVTTSEKTIEAFSIAFSDKDEDVHMHLGWANTIVTVPITQ